MSIHNSFKSGGGMGKHRNVLTREERLSKLAEGTRWNTEEKILGMPKVRSIKVVMKKKKKKTED